MQDVQVIKVLIVDPHAVVDRGISTVLSTDTDFDIVGLAQSGIDALQHIEQDNPDILLVDIDLPGQISGMDLIRMVRRKSPQIQIVVPTNLLEEQMIQEVLQAEVIGYLLKNTSLEDLAHAIRAAYSGKQTFSSEVIRLMVYELLHPLQNGHNLTSREHEVLKLLARGVKQPANCRRTQCECVYYPIPCQQHS